MDAHACSSASCCLFQCVARRRRSRTYKSGPLQIRVQYNAEDVMLACYWLRVAEIVATPARRLTGLDTVAARSISYLFSDVYVYCIHDMYVLSPVAYSSK